MFFAVCKDSDIIDVHLEIAHVVEYIFHDFLSKVGGLLESHWCAVVLELAKGSDNDTQLLCKVAQLEGIVLHTYVDLGEEFVPFSLA
jgi:hypothetical protein